MKAKAKRHDFRNIANAEKCKPAFHYHYSHSKAMTCFNALIHKETMKNINPSILRLVNS